MRLRLVTLAVLIAAVVPAIALAAGGAGPSELYATLNGNNEVPKGDPKASGTAEIKFTRSTGKVCWEFKLKGVKSPSAAHIHKGKAHTAGGVVIPLGTAFKLEGCTTAPKSLVKAILASPSDYYVNVHNAKYPAGVVRGQLFKTNNG
jgi:hypothetical protein